MEHAVPSFFSVTAIILDEGLLVSLDCSGLDIFIDTLEATYQLVFVAVFETKIPIFCEILRLSRTPVTHNRE